MFVVSSVARLNGKTCSRRLLRETYREDGKVKHRTLANLAHCGGAGDPAGAEAQGRFASHPRLRRRGRAGAEAGAVGRGGLGSVAVGARDRPRRRPRLGSAGQAGAVAGRRARARPGFAAACSATIMMAA